MDWNGSGKPNGNGNGNGNGAANGDTGRRTMILLPKRSDKVIYGPGIETDQKQIKANQGVYRALWPGNTICLC